jgi:hypothetical protein
MVCLGVQKGKREEESVLKKRRMKWKEWKTLTGTSSLKSIYIVIIFSKFKVSSHKYSLTLSIKTFII